LGKADLMQRQSAGQKLDALSISFLLPTYAVNGLFEKGGENES
jgi:hypothetical protein